MTMTTLAQRARADAARLLAWARRRGREPSTWAGLALVATDLGFPGLSAKLALVGKDLPILLAIAGGAVAAATTSQHPPAPQP